MKRTSPTRVLAVAPAVFLASLLSSSASAETLQSSGATAATKLAQLHAALDVTDLSVQELRVPDAPGAPFQMDVAFGGRLERLVVWPHSVRSPEFQLLVQGADGAYVPTEPAPVATYRGELVGLPGSVVAGSVIDGQFEGLVRFAPGDDWSIQPASRYVDGFARSAHAVHSAFDATLLEASCGTDTTGAEEALPLPPPPPGSPMLQYVIQIACDADTQFYSQNGSSVSATQLDIENIVNAMEAIYVSDVDVLFTIPKIVVRTSEPDPYSSSNASTMLDEVANHWKSVQFATERDLAHLFTGKNISGSTIGIAYLVGLGSNNDGYGVSQSKFSGNFTSRVGLTAHEVGHNCAASHCNGSPSGCTIMCSSINGCDGSLTSFSPSSINAISSKVMFSNCLEVLGLEPPDPPVISSILPTQIASLVPGNAETVSIIGTDLDNVGEVKVNGSPLPGFLPKVTFQSPNLITFDMPNMPVLGSVSVEVLGGDIGSDSGSIEVVPASPPALELGTGVDPEVLFSLLPVTLQVGGQPGNIHLVWASFDPSPSVFPGLFSLDIGGFTNLILLAAAAVEPKAWSDIVLTPVVNLPFGTLIYFQGVEYDPFTGAQPLEASNVRTAEWWF